MSGFILTRALMFGDTRVMPLQRSITRCEIHDGTKGVLHTLYGGRARCVVTHADSETFLIKITARKPPVGFHTGEVLTGNRNWFTPDDDCVVWRNDEVPVQFQHWF